MHELTFSQKKVYTVKRGQTLWEIAEAFGVSPYAIIRENRIERLSEGCILTLPTGKFHRAEAGERGEKIYPTLSGEG